MKTAKAKWASIRSDEITLDEFGLPLTIKTGAIAAITGVGSARLDQLIRDGRIPITVRAERGSWQTAAALREIVAYYRRQADRAKPQADRNFETQVKIEDLRGRRIKNAKAARELLPRHVYIQVWGELLASFKNRWLDFAHKMGPRVFRAKDKVEAAGLLDREIRGIFGALNDPKFMEDIAARILDDEFEGTDATIRDGFAGHPEPLAASASEVSGGGPGIGVGT